MNRLWHAVLLLATLATTSPALAGSVIVGPGTDVDTLDEDQVRRLFLGREAVLAGRPVTVLFQKGGSTRQAFDARVLQKPGAQLGAYWSSLVFTGKARAPVEVANDAAVKAMLATTPGAIGYVHDSSVDRSVHVVLEF